MNLARIRFLNFRKNFNRPAALILFAMVALMFSGCSMLQHIPGSQTKSRVDSFNLTNHPSGLVTLTVMESQVMRFADTYAATVSQACDDISARSTNADFQLAMLRWKLGQATAAYTDATGVNPAVNALDVLVLTTMARMVVEDYGVQTYGDSIQPLLAAQRNMETNAWKLASGVLKPPQVQELREMINDWRVKNPNQRYVGPVRFSEFVSALGKAPPPPSSAPTSIFSLLYLDPLAGLDPTAAAIKETRELGERVMYYGQRMPLLLNWQVQVLAFQLVNHPDARQLLGDIDRTSASLEVFAETARQLPQLINDQRQAAIQQIFDGFTAQGTNSHGLLSESRLTLDSAGAAATNINTAIQSLTAFVQYVSPTNAAPSANTNSKPFNVLDYGTAAEQVGGAASNLTVLLASVNQSLPQLEKLGQQTTADANGVVQHAFWLGLVLIVVLLAGSVLAGLVYRILANRLTRNDGKSSKP